MVSARIESGVSTSTAADGNIRVTICAEEAEEQGSSGPMTTNEHATSSSTALLLQVPGPVAKVDSNSNAITVNTTPTTTTIVITTTLVVTTTTEHNRKPARTRSGGKKKKRKKKQKKEKHNNYKIGVATEDEEDTTARVLMTKLGFNPEDIDEIKVVGYDSFPHRMSTTPIIHFCRLGNVRMCRYLIFRGADCLKLGWGGNSPMYWAAMAGHLEIMKLLLHHGGAHEDVRRMCDAGTSPLQVAFDKGYLHVVRWLILNGALSSPLRRRRNRNSIHTYTLRRAMRSAEGYDKRLPILTWAQNAIATHEQFQLSSFIPLVELRGKSDVLERIAEYSGYRNRHELRIFRQLLQHLQAFIEDVPFIHPQSRFGPF